MALLLDAALGTAISELLRLVVAVGKQRGDFRGNLETLKNTLESAILTLNETEKFNIVLNRRPEENMYQFIHQLIRVVNLVKKCIKIPYWKTHKYSNKLAELDERIEKFFNIVQGSVAVNTLRNGVGIQEINDKIDFMFKYFNIKYEREIHAKNHSGAFLREFSDWEIFHGPPDEFEMLHVDAEIETDSSGEFSSWVIVPSLDDSKEMTDCSLTDLYNDLRSFPEGQRIPAITYMHMCSESANSLDLKDMNTHSNFVEPSIRNLPDVVCTSRKYVDSKMEEAYLIIRKRLPGVVVREFSSEIIRSQASEGEATSTGGGKGKEKVVCKPKKNALKS